MTRPAKSELSSPFLRSVELDPRKEIDRSAYPFTIPAIDAAPSLRIDFTTPVTIFVGPNGSGKSTLLEALAYLCGFGALGGTRNYASKSADEEILGRSLRAAWRPKVTAGFYIRAETFFGFLTQAQGYGADDYGGRPLAEQSHGEAYLSIFAERLQRRGIYILDEPEAALSPSRQIDFLRLLKRGEQSGNAQFILATHSPLIMAYPGASLLHLTRDGIVERPFALTEHYRILREFYLDPEGFMAAVFSDM